MRILTILILFSFPSLIFGQDEVPEYIPVVISSWWQIANEDYDAGEFSNKPEEGEATFRLHQEVSDFTIYKAADGKWQLISAVRNTKYPGTNHFLMRWEADDITDQNWEEKGIFCTTADFPLEAGYTEGVFFAPHCVKVDGKYYMFHNSDRTCHVLISDDGINFTPYKDTKGSYIQFDTGEAGRDLMLLDNRERDNLFYIYYTGFDKTREDLVNRQYTDVYLRTSNYITGPWSDSNIVGMGTPNRPREIVHSKADFVNAESQFVVYNDDFYYKFEQAFVVASNDPKDFNGKPIVANLFPHFTYPEDWTPGLAPEIIIDGEKMYIAYFMNHHTHPLRTLKQGGVFVAEMKWQKRRE